MNLPAACAATATCIAATAVLVWADARGMLPLRAAAKTLASAAFVAVALALEGLATPFGQALTGALLLGALGDLLLLGRRNALFLAGLVAFLLAHAAFAAAFVLGGLNAWAVMLAGLPALLLGRALLRWMRPHLPDGMRAPVLAYVATILLMCALAAGHAVHAGSTGPAGHATHAGAGWLPAAALLFAASDVAVARERFVQPAVLNRAWGLPTYYAAQLIFAWSLAGVAPA